MTSSKIHHTDGTTETTRDAAVWTLAHRGYSGGGRLDVWVYPSRAAALHAGADLAMESGLEQRLLQPVHQRLLNVVLEPGLGQVQEVEHVRVLGQLLRQVGIGRGELLAEVRRRRRDPAAQADRDLVLEYGL